MDFQLPVPVTVLAIVLLIARILATLWLLRMEARGHLKGLFFLTLGAAVLRLLWIYDLPPGLNEDETKTLRQAMSSGSSTDMLLPGIEAPILHAILFQLPIANGLKSLFWGSRLYPLVCSIIGVPLAFVIGRSLQFSARTSYLLTLLVTVLPWSLFWSRLPWGGEIIFYQLLLVAAVSRIIWRDGGWRDVLVGIVGLSGLLWEYTGAWSMASIPVIGFILAFGIRGRLRCLSILLGAILLWLPYMLRARHWVHYITEKVSSPAGSFSSQNLVNHYTQQLTRCIEVFWTPTGNTSWLSMHSVAIHPYLVLATAVIGLFTLAPRKALFTLGGFSAGLLPVLVSGSSAPSTHRIICSYLFISIASVALFHRLERLLARPSGKLISGLLAAGFAVSVTIASLKIFLSDEFWRNAEGGVFLHGETLLSEALEPTKDFPAILAGSVVVRAEVTKDTQLLSMLSYGNWLPASQSIYGFSREFENLLPVYSAALPSDQVRVFGGADYPKSFTAQFSAKDVAAWNAYGLALTIDCKDGTEAQTFRVPVVMIEEALNGFRLYCKGTHEYRYRATWVGPPTDLILVHSPAIRVLTSSPNALRDGDKMRFSVATGEPLELTITFPNSNGIARLLMGGESASRLPPLSSFTP
jgi:hypothetical protein